MGNASASAYPLSPLGTESGTVWTSRAGRLHQQRLVVLELVQVEVLVLVAVLVLVLLVAVMMPGLRVPVRILLGVAGPGWAGV